MAGVAQIINYCGFRQMSLPEREVRVIFQTALRASYQVPDLAGTLQLFYR